jgi:hypothetical protein
MGYKFIDQFSLLHFAAGVIAYFWGISFFTTIIVHTLFEVFENTKDGMWFINYYFTIWPGGKSHPDSLVNSIGDTIFTGIGWIASYLLDKKYRV